MAAAAANVSVPLAVYLINRLELAAVLGHYEAKPLLQQNLVDLVQADLASAHSVLVGLICAFDFAHNVGAEDAVPRAAYLAYAWVMQLMIQTVVVYLNYGIIFRYMYAVSHMGFLEGFSEGTVQHCLRFSTVAANAAVCAALHVLGLRPYWYVTFYQKSVAAAEKAPSSDMAVRILAFVSIAINLVLRITIRRKVSGIPSHQSQAHKNVRRTGRALCVSLVFLVVMATLTVILVANLDDESFVWHKVFAAFYGNVIPAVVIAVNPGFRERAVTVVRKAVHCSPHPIIVVSPAQQEC